MTTAERRRQSAGVSRITDYVPGDADWLRVSIARRALEAATGRSLRCVGTEYDGRGTVTTFEVIDKD